MADRFDKFTERARRILRDAEAEALRLRHDYIGTEHLLLALIGQDGGVAVTVLGHLGIDPNEVRASIDRAIRPGPMDWSKDPNMGLDLHGKESIVLSVDEARRLRHHYIGSEHLLLGLVREADGLAAVVLRSLGVSLDMARGEVIRVLSRTGVSPQARPSPRSGEVAIAPPLRVFLCHASDDKPAVRALFRRLTAEDGVEP